MAAKPAINMNLSVPRALHAAVEQLARRELISNAAYVRRALFDRLQRDGIKFDAADSHPST